MHDMAFPPSLKDYVIDHLIPLELGGSNGIKYLAPIMAGVCSERLSGKLFNRRSLPGPHDTAGGATEDRGRLVMDLIANIIGLAILGYAAWIFYKEVLMVKVERPNPPSRSFATDAIGVAYWATKAVSHRRRYHRDHARPLRPQWRPTMTTMRPRTVRDLDRSKLERWPPHQEARTSPHTAVNSGPSYPSSPTRIGAVPARRPVSSARIFGIPRDAHRRRDMPPSFPEADL